MEKNKRLLALAHVKAAGFETFDDLADAWASFNGGELVSSFNMPVATIGERLGVPADTVLYLLTSATFRKILDEKTTLANVLTSAEHLAISRNIAARARIAEDPVKAATALKMLREISGVDKSDRGPANTLTINFVVDPHAQRKEALGDVDDVLGVLSQPLPDGRGGSEETSGDEEGVPEFSVANLGSVERRSGGKSEPEVEEAVVLSGQQIREIQQGSKKTR